MLMLSLFLFLLYVKIDGRQGKRSVSPQKEDQVVSSPATPASEAGDSFIDDDFGLSSIRRESEQIRQQQLLIEQEVRSRTRISSYVYPTQPHMHTYGNCR